MSLIQLVAYGSENTNFNIQHNLAVEYFTENFQNNSLIMERNCDTKCPEYLEFELSPNVDVNDFKNICHKICFETEIGGQIILSIPLRFMIYLKNYQIYDNKFYITIPFQMFCDDIKLISLQYHVVRFYLTNTENYFSSCNLISKGIFYDMDDRRLLAENSYQNIIQQLTSVEINSLNERNEFNLLIQFHNGIHKGFFIECQNVDEINQIKFKLHSQERINYNRFLVRTKCVKMNEQLLYFPFNFDKLYSDRTRQGFEGAINLSRIDVSILNIKFDNPQSKICIYGLGSNLMCIQQGMGGLRFIYNYNNLHRYEEYNENAIESTREIISINNDTSETIIYKFIIDNEKKICCITYEEISLNSRYMICSECNNNYSEESLKQWFIITRQCPMCRSDWTDYNIYINAEHE